MKPYLAAFISALLVGCASAAPLPPGPPSEPPVAPTATPDSRPTRSPTNDESAFALDVRADAVLGRIGAMLGTLGVELERARADRDVVQTLCLADKRKQLSAVERDARAARGAVRDAVLEDENAAFDSFSELIGYERAGRGLVFESEQCVGEDAAFVGKKGEYADTDGLPEPDNDADGLPDSEDKLPEGAIQLDAPGPPSTLRSSEFGAPPPPPQKPAPSPSAGPVSVPNAPRAPHDASRLIRTAELTLAVFEVEQKLAKVESIAKESGGYLSLRSDREITVRVPRERFDDTLATIEKLGDVLHRSVAAEDVTDQYVDLEMRLKNALDVRERLAKLLEKATVKDAIEIQKELARTTEEIERLRGKLELLRDRIGYSTITVSFERTQPEPLRSRALLPFPWMRVLGLAPLLEVPR